jgi:hypothetical protein
LLTRSPCTSHQAVAKKAETDLTAAKSEVNALNARVASLKVRWATYSLSFPVFDTI